MCAKRYVFAAILLLFLVSGLGLVFPVFAPIAKGKGLLGPAAWMNRSNKFPNIDSNAALVSDVLVAAPLIAVFLAVALLGYFQFRENRNMRDAIARA